jgi:hypothetical protein
MQSENGQKFYMYQTDTFMAHVRKYLKHTISAEAIKEVKEVKKERGERLKAVFAAQEAVEIGDELRNKLDRLLMAKFVLSPEHAPVWREMTVGSGKTTTLIQQYLNSLSKLKGSVEATSEAEKHEDKVDEIEAEDNEENKD